MNNRLRVLLGLMALLIAGAVLPSAVSVAQPDACPAVAEQALSFVGDNCAGIGRNRACYGFQQVNATFFADAGSPMFGQPRDRVDVPALQSISTSALDLSAREWGIAVMNLQANVPSTLPGQSVVFVLAGEATVEDSTPPGARAIPSDVTLSVTPTSSVILRDAPELNGDITFTLPAGIALTLDTRTADDAWVRGTVRNVTGWVERMTLPDELDVSVLPVYDPGQFTPMQSFYVTTGLGQGACQQTPNAVLVQGPQQFTVDLRANGADIRLGSTIILREVGSPPRLQLFTIDGDVELNLNSIDELRVPRFFMSEVLLGPPSNLGVDTNIQNRPAISRWSPPRPITPAEVEFIRAVVEIPTEVINYPIVPPEPLPTPTACVFDPTFTARYTVQPGDTLASIGAVYGVSAQALAAGNCLADVNVIQVGQTLRVPPLGVLPTLTPTPTNTPNPGGGGGGGGPTPVTDAAAGIAVSNPNPIEGSTFDFSYIVSNPGTEPLTGVQAAVTSTPALLATELLASVDNIVTSVGAYDATAGTWDIGPLAAGASASITYTVTLSTEIAPDTLNLATTITNVNEADSNPGNNTAALAINIQPLPIGPDVQTTITVSGPNPFEGDEIQITLSATNAGTTDATGVVITDDIFAQINANFTAISLSTTPVGTYDLASGTWNLGTLPVGTTYTVEILATAGVGSAATYNLSADVTALNETDINPGNNASTFALTIQPATGPDMQITFTSSNPAPVENEAITLTMIVQNLSTTTDATNVVVNAPIQTQLGTALGSLAVTGGPPSYSLVNDTWTVGTVPAGTSQTVTFSGTVIPGQAGGAATGNVNIIGLNEVDPNGANNAAALTLGFGFTDISVTSFTEDVIPNDGICTLSEAVNAANGDVASGNVVGECATGNGADTIILALGTYNVPAGVFPGSSGSNGHPLITSDITIQGGGSVMECTGIGIYRLFEVSPGGVLTLNQLSMSGCNASNGGLLYNNGGTLTIGGGTTLSAGSADLAGGAIYHAAGTTIVDGVVTGSSTGMLPGGGGIYIASGTVNINGTVSNSSSGIGPGGGVYVAGPSAVLNVSGTISGNVAATSGGGIYNAGNEVNINAGAQITGNTANDGKGGGIANDGGLLTITNAVIANNVGAVVVGGSGGGLFDSGSTTITGGAFNNNQGHDGGAIGVDGAIVNVNGTTFDGNQATSGTGNGGGVGYVAAGQLNFVGAVFTNNTTANPSSAHIVQTGGGVVSFANSTFGAGNGGGLQDCLGGITNNGGNSGGDGTCYP